MYITEQNNPANIMLAKIALEEFWKLNMQIIFVTLKTTRDNLFMF